MTDIRTVADANLERWVAEKLEPYATLPQPVDGCFDAYLYNDGYWQTKFKCWDMKYVWVTEKDEQWKGWQARQFCTDPAAILSLLETPGFVSLTLIDDDGVYDATFCGEAIHTPDCGEKMQTAQHPKLGRCLVEAFCLANGWKPAE